MPTLSREELDARYALFKKYAFNDQRNYYRTSINRSRQAGRQVNRYRALCAFVTGLASALAGLVVQLSFNTQGQCVIGKQQTTALGQVAGILNSINTMSTGQSQPSCSLIQAVVNVLLVVAVLAPAMGGAFNILSDLYQWDRLTTTYTSALKNMEFADTRLPDEAMPDDTYKATLHLFGMDTLSVMYEEAAQWGQTLHTPTMINSFLAEESGKAETVEQAPTSLLPPSAIPAPGSIPSQPPLAAPAANSSVNLSAAPNTNTNPLNEPSVG